MGGGMCPSTSPRTWSATSWENLCLPGRTAATPAVSARRGSGRPAGGKDDGGEGGCPIRADLAPQGAAGDAGYSGQAGGRGPGHAALYAQAGGTDRGKGG